MPQQPLSGSLTVNPNFFKRSLLLVGHEPYLSQLIAVLIGGEKMRMDFKKGGLCCISAESLTFGRCATLEWLLTPKMLRTFDA